MIYIHASTFFDVESFKIFYRKIFLYFVCKIIRWFRTFGRRIFQDIFEKLRSFQIRNSIKFAWNLNAKTFSEIYVKRRTLYSRSCVSRLDVWRVNKSRKTMFCIKKTVAQLRATRWSQHAACLFAAIPSLNARTLRQMRVIYSDFIMDHSHLPRAIHREHAIDIEHLLVTMRIYRCIARIPRTNGNTCVPRKRLPVYKATNEFRNHNKEPMTEIESQLNRCNLRSSRWSSIQIVILCLTKQRINRRKCHTHAQKQLKWSIKLLIN